MASKKDFLQNATARQLKAHDNQSIVKSLVESPTIKPLPAEEKKQDTKPKEINFNKIKRAKQTKRVQLVLQPELFDLLKTVTKEEGYSVNSYVIDLIIEDLKEREAEQ